MHKGPGFYRPAYRRGGCATRFATPFDTPTIGIPCLMPPLAAAAIQLRTGGHHAASVWAKCSPWFGYANHVRFERLHGCESCLYYRCPRQSAHPAASAMPLPLPINRLPDGRRYAGPPPDYSQTCPQRPLSCFTDARTPSCSFRNKICPDRARSKPNQRPNREPAPSPFTCRLPYPCLHRRTRHHASTGTAQQFESAVQHHPDSVWLIQDRPTKLPACLPWKTVFDESELHLIAVAPEYRRSGICIRLLQHPGKRSCNNKGATRLLLSRRSSMKPRNSFPTTNHGQTCGCRKTLLYALPDGGSEDAVLMEKSC